LAGCTCFSWLVVVFYGEGYFAPEKKVKDKETKTRRRHGKQVAKR